MSIPTKPVLDWMHSEVVKQMHDHPPGTCYLCDRKREEHVILPSPPNTQGGEGK